MRKATLRAGLVLALALAGAALAQLDLVVDGRRVGEVRTDLVSGHSYAPADALASGFRATLAAPPGTDVAALSLGGHVLRIDVVETVGDAARDGAARLEGEAVGDLAAVRGDDALWLPVTPTARAFGASVAYMSDRGAIVVVSPRPTVRASSLRSDRDEDVLSVSVDAPVSWSRFENAALGLTEVHLPRARLERARSLDGDVARRVDLLPEEDGVRIRVDAPGATLDVVALPDGAGTEVRVRARAGDEEASDEDDRTRTVVLDAGSDPAARRAATAVARLLRDEGLRVAVTPAGEDLADRAAAGASADLFASFARADLPAGEIRVWVLGDPADAPTLDAAVRVNAAAALDEDVEDEVRRRILLGLVPDLEVGRRYGRAITSALFQVGGYRAGNVDEAPLAVLGGASGRGVYLEASADDLEDDRLAEALAAALESAVGGAP